MSKVKLFFLLFLLSAAPFSVANKQACWQSYAIEVDTRTLFTFSGKQHTHMHLNGNLSIRPLLGTPPNVAYIDNGERKKRELIGQWWGLKLSEVTLVGNGQILQADPSYDLAFALFREENGKLSHFKTLKQLASEELDKLKGLAYYLQFLPTNKFSGTHSSRSETDTLGEMSTSYRKHEQSLVKEKKHYIRLANLEMFGGDEPTIALPISNHTIIESDCWFKSVIGEEVMEMKGNKESFTFHSAQRYNISQLEKLASSTLWSLPDDIALWQIEKAPVLKLSEDEKKKLAKKLASELSTLDISAILARDLSKTLLKYDAVISSLASLFIDNTFNDADSMRLFNALGLMDSENGNQLLVDLLQSPELSETQRFRAMRAIASGQKAITPSLNESLMAIVNADEFSGSPALRSASLLTIGAIIERREASQESNFLLESMRERLVLNANVIERAALVAGIGNTGRANMTSLVAGYADDESHRVRANAAFALGRFGTEEARSSLSGMLKQKQEKRTQQAVLKAISQFNLTPKEFSRVSDIARVSTSERTRAEAIRALASQKKQPDKVKAELSELLKQEPSRKNFALIAKSINAINKKSE